MVLADSSQFVRARSCSFERADFVVEVAPLVTEALLKTIQSCISSNVVVLFHQLHTLLGKVPMRLIGIEIRTHWTPGYGG